MWGTQCRSRRRAPHGPRPGNRLARQCHALPSCHPAASEPRRHPTLETPLFKDLPLWLNAAIFIASAAVVWRVGTQLARLADAIAARTGLGHALLGVLLLGGVTSLPELASSVSGTLAGAPRLAVNGVLGSAAFNVVILAVADAVHGRKALTSTPGSPGVMLQGALSMMMLSLAIAPVTTGDVLVWGIGAWSWVLLGAFVAAMVVLSKAQSLDSWRPRLQGAEPPATDSSSGPPLRSLLCRTAAAAVLIIGTGFLLARSADALAAQTGLGQSFFGAVLLGASTSLPEASTVLAAMRLRRYEMALADVLGTNLFNVVILVAVDAVHDGGPVLVEAGGFAAFGALLAVVLTGVFLVGLIERRDRTLLRMGYDSVAVLGLYAAGVAVLYQLR